jgi:hypothetical protein
MLFLLFYTLLAVLHPISEAPGQIVLEPSLKMDTTFEIIAQNRIM